MKTFTKTILLAFATLLLFSCGGGGGGGPTISSPGTKTLTLTVTPESTSSTPSSLLGVTVRVVYSDGSIVNDGTRVTLQVSPSNVGLVSSTQLGANAPPNNAAIIGDSASGLSAGGIVNFRLHTRNLGSAVLTASATDPITAITNSGTSTVVITAGPPRDSRLVLQPVTATLPANAFNFQPYWGSPYMSEVTMTWRNLDGTLVTARQGRNDQFGVSINPVNPTGGFSVLDDPSTPDVNEFTNRLGQGPVNVVAGKGTVFFHSFNFAATATMTVSVTDQVTNETISAQQVFTIINGSPPLPATVDLNSNGVPVYIQGSGGNNSALLEAHVRDGGGSYVPAVTGINNVKLDIVGTTSGDRLVGINAQGQNVAGSSIVVRSNNGIANASYQSGTRVGVVTLRVTADRADNNVDNGIQDAVTATRGVTVSDGRLFDLDITSPVIGAITVNPPLLRAEDGVEYKLPNGTTLILPVSPDGTYSLTVSALATDRQGNPVVPNTEIKFGVIDAPLDGRQFAIRGSDGNPQEGGNIFTSPSGGFNTLGGGAGPGDTILVFGEESFGNRDLEGARTLASVNSSTSLSTTYRFNHNDDTGVPVDRGNVLPFVIGRATKGNITASAFTNLVGVATVKLTYAGTQLGRTAGIWAQGSGDIVNGTAELVADVELIGYPGIAPALITASPASIPANVQVPINVCLTDALGVPFPNVPVSFAFNVNGSGTVDGIPGAGQVASPTGSNGCVTVAARANVATAGTGSLVFTAGGASVSVSVVSGASVLSGGPLLFYGNTPAAIVLFVQSSTGGTVGGVLVTGSCTAPAGQSLTITGGLGILSASGTTVQVVPSGFESGYFAPVLPATAYTRAPTPADGTCVFTGTGVGSVTVTFRGLNTCDAANVPPTQPPAVPAQVCPP